MDRPTLPPRVRRTALDWAVPLAILAIGIVNLSGHPSSVEYPGSPWRHAAFLVVSVALLGVRRKAPLLVGIMVLVVATGGAGCGPSSRKGRSRVSCF